MSGWGLWILPCLILLYLTTTATCGESAGKGEIFPSSTRPPQECLACSPGYGVTRICDTSEDTHCAPCPTGSFNPKPTKDSACATCKTCPEEFYEWMPCNAIMNTVCEACQLKPSGSGNEDYLKKCERTTLPTTTHLYYPSSTRSGDRGPDDLEDFLTEGQGLTSPEEDKEGGEGESGESSGEDLEVSPPVNTRTVYSVIFSSSPVVVTEGESTEASGAGLVVFDENTDLSGASFSGWPILLAALVAALICFVVGAIIGIVLKRRRKDLAKEKSARSDPEVHIAMVPNGKESYPDPLGTVSQERTPIYTGAPPSPDEVDYSKSPVIYRHKKPHRSALKTRSFGGSRDFSYIDEDSEDEMVQHLGRPPSIYFKDRKKRNKRKPRGFFSRLRRPRPKSHDVSERKKVKRAESMEPKEEQEADESTYGTV